MPAFHCSYAIPSPIDSSTDWTRLFLASGNPLDIPLCVCGDFIYSLKRVLCSLSPFSQDLSFVPRGSIKLEISEVDSSSRDRSGLGFALFPLVLPVRRLAKGSSLFESRSPLAVNQKIGISVILSPILCTTMKTIFFPFGVRFLNYFINEAF